MTHSHPPQPVSEAALLDVADRLGLEGKGRMRRCPFHPDTGRPNLSLFIRDGGAGFRCHSCGEHGSLADLVMRTRHLTYRDAIAWIANAPCASPSESASPGETHSEGRPEPTRPPESLPDLSGCIEALADDDDAIGRLAARGVSERGIARGGIGLDRWRGARAWVFPLRDDLAQIISAKWRLVPGEPPPRGWPSGVKSRNARGRTTGLLMPTDFDATQPVVVTEGEIDWLLALTWGWNAVGLPGANPGRETQTLLRDLLEPSPEITLALDDDEPGRRATERLIEVLGPRRTHVAYLPGDAKDLGELAELLQQSCELPEQALAEPPTLDEFQPVPAVAWLEARRDGVLFRDALVGLRFTVASLIRSVSGHPVFRFGDSFPALNEALGAFSEPTPLLALIVGGPKSGKTNMLVNLALWLLSCNPRTVVAHISAEVPCRPLRARMICCQAEHSRGPEDPPVMLSDLSAAKCSWPRDVRRRIIESMRSLRAITNRWHVLDREALPGGVICPEAIEAALAHVPRAPGDPLIVLLDYDAYLRVPGRAEGIARDEIRLQALLALANRHRALVITPHQARKGAGGAGWSGGGFEATKGSGEYVYAADLVMRLKSRDLNQADAPCDQLIRVDLMNRHGPSRDFFLEARHGRAWMREAADQTGAEMLWKGAGDGGAGPGSGPDPALLEAALRRIDEAVAAAGGKYTEAARILGLEVSDTTRLGIRRAHVNRQISAHILSLLPEV